MTVVLFYLRNYPDRVVGAFVVCCFEPSLRFKFWRGGLLKQVQLKAWLSLFYQFTLLWLLYRRLIFPQESQPRYRTPSSGSQEGPTSSTISSIQFRVGFKPVFFFFWAASWSEKTYSSFRHRLGKYFGYPGEGRRLWRTSSAVPNKNMLVHRLVTVSYITVKRRVLRKTDEVLAAENYFMLNDPTISWSLSEWGSDLEVFICSCEQFGLAH